MLALAVACTFYISTTGIVLIVKAHRSLFHRVPEWLLSRGFAELLVLTALLGTVSLFGRFRDHYLRRDHLKVAIKNYGNEWVELAVSEPTYFGELEKQSHIWTA